MSVFFFLALYLLQRYVVDQPADNCPWRRLSHIHLLHIEAVCVRVLLRFDYTSNTQVETRHIHFDIFLAGGGLFLLCFLPS